jgi:heme oxygenase (mycobilin-producing)
MTAPNQDRPDDDRRARTPERDRPGPPVTASGRRAGMIGNMTVVKINAITVPADSGDELAKRFAARAGAVDNQDGFEGFELFKPTDERTTWLVVTRWRDEDSFQAWLNSPAFGHGHRSAAERSGGEAPPPVGISSELWSYEIAGGSAG